MGRTLTGTVISDKADKTIVILSISRKTHPLYKKQYTKRTKYMAHDPDNKAKLGDLVLISETRPKSAKKRFILDSIIQKATVKFEQSDAEVDINSMQSTQKSEAK